MAKKKGIATHWNEEELKRTCYKIAEDIIWKKKKYGASDLPEVDRFELGEQYFTIAKCEAKHLINCGYDPSKIAKMVRYLGLCHALPPMGMDTQWFSDMLGVLVALCCPQTGWHSKLGMKEIVEDLKLGIAEWERMEE